MWFYPGLDPSPPHQPLSLHRWLETRHQELARSPCVSLPTLRSPHCLRLWLLLSPRPTLETAPRWVLGLCPGTNKDQAMPANLWPIEANTSLLGTWPAFQVTLSGNTALQSRWAPAVDKAGCHSEALDRLPQRSSLQGSETTTCGTSQHCDPACST